MWKVGGEIKATARVRGRRESKERDGGEVELHSGEGDLKRVELKKLFLKILSDGQAKRLGELPRSKATT